MKEENVLDHYPASFYGPKALFFQFLESVFSFPNLFPLAESFLKDQLAPRSLVVVGENFYHYVEGKDFFNAFSTFYFALPGERAFNLANQSKRRSELTIVPLGEFSGQNCEAFCQSILGGKL